MSSEVKEGFFLLTKLPRQKPKHQCRKKKEDKHHPTLTTSYSYFDAVTLPTRRQKSLFHYVKEMIECNNFDIDGIKDLHERRKYDLKHILHELGVLILLHNPSPSVENNRYVQRKTDDGFAVVLNLSDQPLQPTKLNQTTHLLIRELHRRPFVMAKGFVELMKAHKLRKRLISDVINVCKAMGVVETINVTGVGKGKIVDAYKLAPQYQLTSI